MRLRRNEIEADELGYRPSITLLISVDLNLCSLSNLVRHNCQFDVDEALTKRQHLKQVTVPKTFIIDSSVGYSPPRQDHSSL